MRKYGLEIALTVGCVLALDVLLGAFIIIAIELCFGVISSVALSLITIAVIVAFQMFVLIGRNYGRDKKRKQK